VFPADWSGVKAGIDGKVACTGTGVFFDPKYMRFIQRGYSVLSHIQ